MACESDQKGNGQAEQMQALRGIIKFLSKDKPLIEAYSLIEERRIKEVKFKVAGRDIDLSEAFLATDSCLKNCYDCSLPLDKNISQVNNPSDLNYSDFKKYIRKYRVTTHEEWQYLSTDPSSNYIVFFNVVNPNLVFAIVFYNSKRGLLGKSNLQYELDEGPVKYRYGFASYYLFCLKNNSIAKVCCNGNIQYD